MLIDHENQRKERRGAKDAKVFEKGFLCVLCASATSAFHAIPGDKHGFLTDFDLHLNPFPQWRYFKTP